VFGPLAPNDEQPATAKSIAAVAAFRMNFRDAPYERNSNVLITSPNRDFGCLVRELFGLLNHE